MDSLLQLSMTGNFKTSTGNININTFFFNNREPKILFQEAPLSNNSNNMSMKKKTTFQNKRERIQLVYASEISTKTFLFYFALLSTWFVPPQISKWWSHGVAAVKIIILLLILISQFYDA